VTRIFTTPDVLVLSAGGLVGEAWMSGVLAGLEEATDHDFRTTPQIIGTSAGAIVAAAISGGSRPRQPGQSLDDYVHDAAGLPLDAALAEAGVSLSSAPGEPLDAAEALPLQPPAPRPGALRGAAWTLAAGAWAAGAPLAAPLLERSAPAGARARAYFLGRLPSHGPRLDDLRTAAPIQRATFDGRLRVVAVDRERGARVVFGGPDAPDAAVGEAVAASCAVPGIFRPVRIGGRAYIDGGAWSLTNLDVADVSEGSEVLCLNVFDALPMGAGVPAPLVALRAGGKMAAALESQALRHRGARLTSIGPDAGSAAAIDGRLMDESRADAALAAGYRQGLTLGLARA
jgi:NTE family protein